MTATPTPTATATATATPSLGIHVTTGQIVTGVIIVVLMLAVAAYLQYRDHQRKLDEEANAPQFTRHYNSMGKADSEIRRLGYKGLEVASGPTPTGRGDQERYTVVYHRRQPAPQAARRRAWDDDEG